MSLPNKYYSDGWWPDREVTTAPRTKYPMSTAAVPDRYMRTSDRDYNVNLRSYVPKIATRTSWTNLLTYSEAFDNAAWTKVNTTVTADQIANPADGLVTGDLILETSATNNHRVDSVATVTAVPTAISVIAKAAGRSYVQLRFTDSVSAAFSAMFDLAAGVAVAGSPNGAVQPLGDGWYRCTLFFTPAAGVGTVRYYFSDDGSSIFYAGDTTKGIYLWGGQVAVGAVSGPYIPTTSATRTISAPNIDGVESECGPGDPFAYLLSEADPTNINSLVGAVTRMYGRIPAPQVRYSSLPITKPNASTLGLAVGSLFDNTTIPLASGITNLGPAYSYIGYLFANNQIYTRKTLSTFSVTQPSGGTYTIAFGASTTAALAWNASIATVNAAINGLASVIAAGITVSVSQNSFAVGTSINITLTVGSTSQRFICNAASLTPAGTTTAFTSLTSTTVQIIAIAAYSTVTAHGFASSGNLAVSTSSADTNQRLLGYNISWVVIDANTIAVDQLLITSAGFAGQLYRSYTPGPDNLGVRITDNFALPGVTVGIATGADIAIPTPLLNDAEFLLAIVTYLTGFRTYNSSQPDQWNKTPMYWWTTTEINMADA